MSFARFLNTPLTVLTPATTTDTYGDGVLDYDAATSRDTLGWFTQLSSVEMIDGRDAVTTDVAVFLAADDPISANDRVVTSDGTWDVVGTPAVRSTPRGPHHVEVRLSKVTDFGGGKP